MREKNLLNSKILIVDDSRANVLALKQALKREGYAHLKSTTDSRKVAEIFQQFHPDLVLLDLVMPHLDGFQVMEQLAELETDGYLPVLVLTSLTDPQTKLKALQAGARDFVTKPLDMLEVLSRIRNLLEVRRLQNEIREQNRNLEGRVRERTAELERTTEALKDFVNIASHDLQEPLRKILVFSDFLARDGASRLNQQSKDHLNKIQKAAQRMRGLMDDLLAYSKVSSKPPSFERTDLNELMPEVLSALEIQREETGGKVEIGNLPTIEADRVQMHLLFQNLISNALKFHRKDHSPEVKVTSRSAKSGGFDIFVEDKGIGFDEKHRDRIFKPFERLHRPGEYEGSGMGLSICSKIVGRHGGTIDVTSRPQRGTTFRIFLPEMPLDPG